MTRTGDLFQETSKILSVSELTRSIRGALETKFRAVWVQGEVSNYKAHPNGHQYFTLKDARAQIACVIWRDAMAPLRQPLADGARIQVLGTVTVYEARGQYQLSVQIVQPFGSSPAWRGIYDDRNHMVVSVNYDTDIGDAWEFADVP